MSDVKVFLDEQEDDGKLEFGSDKDFWFTYSGTNTRLELRSKDIDGSATEGVAFYVDDGTDDVVIPTGNLVLTAGSIQNNVMRQGVPLDSAKSVAAMITPVGAAGDSTTLGLVDGAAAAMYLVGTDFGGGSESETAAFMVPVPANYVAGQTLTLRLRCACLTTKGDGAMTADVNAYVLGDDDAISADLCGTAATAIGAVVDTYANHDFVIDDDATGEVIGPGDVLQVVVTLAGADTGNLGVMNLACNEISLVVSA